MAATSEPFIVGWIEWLALPELGLPSIKAKIDTGARTSALHAFLIEPFGPAAAPMVRFAVHPIPGRLDIAVTCSAPVIDRREVTSSNGERETRLFIRTPVSMGDRTWTIEIGLTNREAMSYRMLLGRQAIRDDMMVDAASSFRQPRLSYRLYRDLPREQPVERPLRIALLSPKPDVPFNRRLVRAAATRGHVVELIDLRRLALSFDVEQPGLFLDGERVAHYDAIVPRLGVRDGVWGAAVVRQLETMGSHSLVPGDALDRRTNRLATMQVLSRARIPHALRRRGGSAPSVDAPAATLRILVIAGSAVAALDASDDGDHSLPTKRLRTAHRLAERAADALGLGLASIDVEVAGEPHRVVGISARPALGRFQKQTGVDVADRVMDAVEQEVGTSTRHRSIAAEGAAPG